MVTGKNIIKKMSIEVHAPSVPIGTQLKDTLGAYLKKEIIPEMDAELNELAKQFPDKIIRFDQINLDLNVPEEFTIQQLKPLFISKLKEQITTSENGSNTMNTTHIITPSKNESDAFLFFIETGAYPWWYDSKNVFTKQRFQNMLEAPSFSENLKEKLKEKHIQKRIIFQFDFEMIEAIYTVLSDSKDIQHFSKTVSKSLGFQAVKVPFWSAVFDYTLTHKDANLLQKLDAIVSSNSKSSKDKGSKKYKVDTSFLKDAAKLFSYISELLNLGIILKKTKQQNIRLLLDKNTSPSASSKLNEETLKSISSTTVTYNLVDSGGIENEFIAMDTSKNNATLTEASEAGILIENAGLVLLHPYIPKLFERMGFLSDNSEGTLKKRIRPEKKATAVHVLHYLACRKEHPYEHELLFEKYLCGIPLEHPLERMITLSENQKEHCSTLLTAVLTHWTALKSSSTEMLQNEFLAREGKLFILEDTEKIYVQRKPYDLLLDKIPWNLTLVKFPWKQTMIHLEW